MYNYLKALHIIFIVTWFAGMFYMPRLFIYNTEAGEKNEIERKVLRDEFRIMMKRLWFGITWPSAILTLIFGLLTLIKGSWSKTIFEPQGRWLLIKLVLVLLLYIYFFFLHRVYREEMRGIFKYSSQQLRIWNEVATIFLVSIVLLAVVKDSMSFVWAFVGLIIFVIALMGAIKLYKLARQKNR